MNYTSIEQSKKLIELGLNPNTADMHWFIKPNTNPYVYVGYDAEAREIYKDTKIEYLSCWSVGALLELMPLSIVGWDNETYIRYFIGNCVEYSTGTSKYDKELISIPSDSMFKCVYFIIKWLLENHYIK